VPWLSVRASGYVEHREHAELPAEGVEVLEVVVTSTQDSRYSGTAVLLDGDPAASARVWVES
jgi:hypothetical protein